MLAFLVPALACLAAIPAKEVLREGAGAVRATEGHTSRWVWRRHWQHLARRKRRRRRVERIVRGFGRVLQNSLFIGAKAENL